MGLTTDEQRAMSRGDAEPPVDSLDVRTWAEPHTLWAIRADRRALIAFAVGFAIFLLATKLPRILGPRDGHVSLWWYGALVLVTSIAVAVGYYLARHLRLTYKATIDPVARTLTAYPYDNPEARETFSFDAIDRVDVPRATGDTRAVVHFGDISWQLRVPRRTAFALADSLMELRRAPDQGQSPAAAGELPGSVA